MGGGRGAHSGASSPLPCLLPFYAPVAEPNRTGLGLNSPMLTMSTVTSPNGTAPYFFFTSLMRACAQGRGRGPN